MATQPVRKDDDLNRQAEEWCKKKNAKFHRKLRVFLTRLFEEERAPLKALPAYRPPACQWYLSGQSDSRDHRAHPGDHQNDGQLTGNRHGVSPF